SDVTDVDGELALGETLTIEFTTLMATCESGKPAKGDNHPGNGNKNQADRRHGNSADAPGRNK
ncbi:MAG: hypothetical protein HKN80_05300, partial [Acidimicrobiia bacterium]|nr:hypothetical protein [Acidimicrobiia bacterium]